MNTLENKRRLADWFRQWRSPLRKFLFSRVSVRSEDLDDVAQEVFFRLLRYDQAELIQHPEAYIFRMAMNVTAEWSLRARARYPHDARWLDELLHATQPDHVVLRDDAQAEIARAIGTLLPRQREILRLHFSEGLAHAQIAERLGLTQRIVKRELIRSYARLRTLLSTELIGAIGHGCD